ncbi:kelch-like protein 10 [Mugil cephalus]|uniref:kelch-like protein 10 n=1 Tax=Mugil cephalus TaxID=48193 RepID=UPI001FB7706A|nr:kelch-like protein 10 [Mugil cephalus]
MDTLNLTSKMSQQENTCAAHRAAMEKRMKDMTSTALNQLRLERKLCDVVIKVGHAEFDAHKVILCSCSLYFRTLFTGMWATPEKVEFTIPGVSPQMMQHIINYAYTHSVPITEDNVVDILAAADQFIVPGMVQACSFFLEDQLCMRNCMGIWKMVDFYHCPEFRHRVFLYILYHFERIVGVSQEFLDLSEEQLAAVLESDYLNVKRENAAFEAILRWINHLPEQRHRCISALLPKVRLGLLSADYLQHNVMNNTMIKNNIECEPIINDAMTRFMVFHASGGPKHCFSNLLSRPRLPAAILVATGGKNGSTAAVKIEAYDARADCWVTLNTDILRAHHGAAVISRYVYLVGGCDQTTHLDTVQKLDLLTCTEHPVASMNSARCYVSVAVHNGCIYAIGGFNGETYLNTVECYKPETNRWTMVAPMRAKRCGAGVATLNGKVYICGGFNGHRSISTVECYEPESNQWTSIPPMRCSRSGLGVIGYRDRIYAVGGVIARNLHLRSAEAYNPSTNRWTSVPSMHIPRSYFGIEVVDDQVFVVGGHDGSSVLSSVERYDEEAGMWYRASNVEISRSNLSCCVLHGLYGLAQGLFPRGPLKVPSEEEAAGGSN